MSIPAISINEFDYHLPEERIAKYPLEERNQSKLLVYKNGEIVHRNFYELANEIPKPACLVMNNTKVVAARLKFKKETGSKIEIFCLEPFETEINVAMQATKEGNWKCMVGNLKRFKDQDVLASKVSNGTLEARIHKRIEGAVIVNFKWTGGEEFAQILNEAGEVPLPPYLNRENQEEDKEWYQTVYAQDNGAVAAPTAGLHFTNNQLNELASQGVAQNYVTLHVSAGTFQPVKADTLDKHNMHAEHIIVSIDFLKWLKKQKKILTVGTTSLRTLESLYWLGVKTIENKALATELTAQETYTLNDSYSREEIIDGLIDALEKAGLTSLKAQTALFTMPGYKMKMIDGLITNFHQPKSTLLALVSALIGNDWKRVYNTALDSDYRFLSYGDSSLLIPKPW